MSGILGNVFAILWIVLGLGIVIFVHELGHFLMAKKNRVPVEIFSLGFGPALLRWRWGQTEYRLSLIPLGGYVKMEGETLAQAAAGATAWQRFEIYVAGSLMNLLVAFPICMLVFWVGKYEAHPVVAVPGTSEAVDGLRPGDRILEVDGRPVESLDEYQQRVVWRGEGTRLSVRVRRGQDELVVEVTSRGSSYHHSEPVRTSLARPQPDSAAEAAGLRAGDRITAVNGTPVLTVAQIQDLFERITGDSARLDVERGSERLTIDLPLTRRPAWEFPSAEEMLAPVVGAVNDHFAAHARFPRRPEGTAPLREGDRICAIDGAPVATWADIRRALQGKGGSLVAVEVERDGEARALRVPAGFNSLGEGVLGILWRETSEIVQVEEGSHYWEHGLRPGMRVLSVGQRSGDVVTELWLEPRKDPRQPRWSDEEPLAPLEVWIEGRAEPIVIPPKEIRAVAATGLVFQHGGWRFLRRRGFAAGLEEGVREPVRIFVMTLAVLRRLVMGEESMKGLIGPVGIADFSYQSARIGFGNFLWILALITVNLGIINLLPLPLLDGGHLTLLAYEKIARRRPGPRFEAIYTYLGLALILGLVLFVTFNDIARLISG